MKKINIAIVDDEIMFRQMIVSFLHRYEEEKDIKFQINQFSDGHELLQEYQSQYDIILLDVEMTKVDGVSTAKEIRQMDNNVVIIFITNLAQFAIYGYEVEALDYVLKPIAYYAFSQKIERALLRMSRRKENYISIPYGKGNVKKVLVSNITYVEVFGHTLIYHTLEGDITTTGAISDVEAILDPKHFFRCNKGYLVNLEHVEGIDGMNAVVQNEQLQISRSKKKAFLDALNDYMNEVSK